MGNDGWVTVDSLGSSVWLMDRFLWVRAGPVDCVDSTSMKKFVPAIDCHFYSVVEPHLATNSKRERLLGRGVSGPGGDPPLSDRGL